MIYKTRTIEIDPTNETLLSVDFGRADAMKFIFDFGSFDTSLAVKSRVFAYRDTDGAYCFGAEFAQDGTEIVSESESASASESASESTSLGNEWLAYFSSLRTSGYSGALRMTVQLVDANGDLINSANILCNVVETNAKTLFEPSPEFRDEVLDALAAAQAAQTAAETAATTATTQKGLVQTMHDAVVSMYNQISTWYTAIESAVSTVNQMLATAVSDATLSANMFAAQAAESANVAVQVVGLNELRTRAENRGYYNITNSATSYLTAPITSLPKTVSYCAFFKTKTIADYQLIIGNYGLGSNLNCGFAIAKNNLNSSVLQYRTTSGTVGYAGYFTDTPYYDGNWHSMVAIVDGTNNKLKLYIDNTPVVLSATTIVAAEIPSTSPFRVGGAENVSNVKVFNFDMSATGAPYSVAEYSRGEGEPIATHSSTATNKAILSLSDAADAAQVRDLAGDGNHVVIIGGVSASKQKNPSSASCKFNFATGATSASGQYAFGSSGVKCLLGNTQSSVFLRASAEVVVNLGSFNTTNLTAYASGVSLAANKWTRVEISAESADALSISPTTTLTAAVAVDCIIEQRKIG